MCKIPHPYDKQPAFHKSWKFKTIQKLTNGNPERKISNKSEMNLTIPQKFMSNPNIHKKQHAKITLFGIYLAWQRKSSN